MSKLGNTKPLDVELLRSVLAYDPDTGFLTWKMRGPSSGRGSNAEDWNRRHSGKRAGAVSSSGYRELSIGNKTLKAHRVCWAMHTGDSHFGALDHIDGNRDNNRAANLRLADPCENARNRKTPVNNKSGTAGICIQPNGKYRVLIQQIHIGTYDCERDAQIARYAALKALGFHENHGRTGPKIDF